ncbi:MAG: DUF998 domain-containing protein [Candidatus Dormiibacterota bacterium]
MAEKIPRSVPARVAMGVVAGPLFASAFSAIGARTTGYDWRRHAVSSPANGRLGWMQRANFIVTGVLYVAAASGLATCPRRIVGARDPGIGRAAGLGLVGSGVFVTDPVRGFPPAATEDQASDAARSATPQLTRTGMLHNVCALPIFLGIPVAGLIEAASFARSREYLWAGYSAGSSFGMIGGFVLFGAAFRHSAHTGVFQRLSIAAGFGWLSALSLRALTSLRQGC